MMIDDDDIGRLRSAARFEYMAARKLGTLLAETVFARGRNARQNRRLLRQVRKLGEVARPGGRSPARNLREQTGNVAFRTDQVLLGRQFQPVAAKIIGASFEQRKLGRK